MISMKRTLIVLIVILTFSCKDKEQIAFSQFSNSNIVSDYSNLFSEIQKDSLVLKIQQFESKTTNEIAIVTVDSIDNDIIKYSVDLANKMGVGKKDKNNGLLILLVKYDRKVRISTGYGTEKILTDSICQVIIDEKMIPQFKQGDFYKGIDNAIDEIIIKWISK